MRCRNTLILFAKAPRICRVKTRLWPRLSHRQCLYLHKQATQHLITSLSGSKKYKLVLYTTNFSSKFSIGKNITVRLQSGFNLGSRMHHAITAELKTSDRVVLIGSDCLEINAKYIDTAFTKLTSNRDIVLGPANDGGYGLVGMVKPNQALFKNIAWGSASVLASTLEKSKSLGLRAHLLDSLVDVDYQQDLEILHSKDRLPAWALSLLPNA